MWTFSDKTFKIYAPCVPPSAPRSTKFKPEGTWCDNLIKAKQVWGLHGAQVSHPDDVKAGNDRAGGKAANWGVHHKSSKKNSYKCFAIQSPNPPRRFPSCLFSSQSCCHQGSYLKTRATANWAELYWLPVARCTRQLWCLYFRNLLSYYFIIRAIFLSVIALVQSIKPCVYLPVPLASISQLVIRLTHPPYQYQPPKFQHLPAWLNPFGEKINLSLQTSPHTQALQVT